jgi:RNA polymerase sigma factor (sigma-70 family)
MKVDASDLAQECQAAAWQGFRLFKGDRLESFRCWLSTILHTLVAQEFRKYGRKSRDTRRELPLDSRRISSDSDLPGDDSGTILDRLVRSEDEGRQHALLVQAMGMLGEQDRGLIRMHLIEELPYAEIAGRLGDSETSLRKRFQRAVRKLTDALTWLAFSEPRGEVPRKREVFRLWRFESLSRQEIASRLDLPPSIVESWIQEAERVLSSSRGEK